MDKVGEVLGRPFLQVVLLLFLCSMECDFQERSSVVIIFPLVSSGSQCACKGSMYGRVFVDVGEVDSGVRVVAVLFCLFLSKILSGLIVDATHAWSITRHKTFFFSWRILMMALWTCVTLGCEKYFRCGVWLNGI